MRLLWASNNRYEILEKQIRRLRDDFDQHEYQHQSPAPPPSETFIKECNTGPWLSTTKPSTPGQIVRRYNSAAQAGRPLCIWNERDIKHLQLDNFPQIGADYPADLEQVTEWGFGVEDPVGKDERFRQVLQNHYAKAPWCCYARTPTPNKSVVTIGVFEPVTT